MADVWDSNVCNGGLHGQPESSLTDPGDKEAKFDLVKKVHAKLAENEQKSASMGRAIAKKSKKEKKNKKSKKKSGKEKVKLKSKGASSKKKGKKVAK